MKVTYRLATIFIVATVLSLTNCYGQAKPKVLIITGNGNVPVQKPEYPPWRHAFQNNKVAEILQDVADVDSTTDLRMLNDGILANYDLLISNSIFLTPDTAQLAALERFIVNGKCLLTLHCGLLSFLNWDKYEQVMGGIFIGGPSTEPETFKVHTENMEFWGYEYLFRKSARHPVSSVVDNFITTDELYYFQPSTPEFHVIARAENHPVMWWHPVGKGKVMSLTLGHDELAKASDGYQKLLINGVRWLVGIPLVHAIAPKPISNRQSAYENITAIHGYVEDSKAPVVFSVGEQSRPDLFNFTVSPDQKLHVSLTGKTGEGKVVLHAKSDAGISSTALAIKVVNDGEGNIASYLGNRAAVSSNENQSTLFDAGNLIDGDSTTRWSSTATESAWMTIDLQKVYPVGRVVLNWEASYASGYQVLVSEFGENWQVVADVRNGDGQHDELTFPPMQARFVKILAQQRAAQKWGYSLYEVEVYKR